MPAKSPGFTAIAIGLGGAFALTRPMPGMFFEAGDAL
jgi:hypothetical protein